MHKSKLTTVKQSLSDEAKELARNVANLDATDEKGNTLLLRAAISNSWDVVKFLMAKGSNVEVANNDGWTLLHSSAFSDNLEMLEILFGDKILYVSSYDTIEVKPAPASNVIEDNSTTIQSPTENGTSHIADKNNTETTDTSADYTITNSSPSDYIDGSTTIQPSTENGISHIADESNTITLGINTFFAPRELNPNVADKYKFTPLHVAADKGSLKVVEYLINHRANLSATATVHFKHNSDLGDSVSYSDTDYYTPLNFAAGRHDGLNIVKCLVQKGANIDAKSLNLAAEGGHLKTLQYLVKKRADLVNAPDNYGDTPLHNAVYGGLRVVKYLRGKGADINAKNNLGKTPLGVALELNKSDIAGYLKDAQHHREKRHLQETISFESKEANLGIKSDNSAIKSNQAIDEMSLWVNAVARTIVDTVKGVSEFFFFPVKSAMDTKHSQSSKATQYTNIKGISEQEALGYSVSIVEEFKKVVEQAALKNGISMHRLNIDFMEMQKEITRKIMGGKFDKISEISKSYIEKACPDRKVGCTGRLSQKKFDKLMLELDNKLDVILNQSIQQIYKNSILEVSSEKEQQKSLRPKNYLDNVSIQGHLTHAKNLRLE